MCVCVYSNLEMGESFWLQRKRFKNSRIIKDWLRKKTDRHSGKEEHFEAIIDIEIERNREKGRRKGIKIIKMSKKKKGERKHEKSK